jgi:uncharacterized protein YndB with AHSA1/START domain
LLHGSVVNTRNKRADTASRIIRASPQKLFEAFLDPEAIASWLPPAGMRGRIDAFEPHAGGLFRITLTYESAYAAVGKTSDHSDVVEGRFVELVPNKRIVQAFEFQSDRREFAGMMTMTWTFTTAPDGTEVTIVCENVPEGIREQDHIEGFRSTLENLAAYTE